MTSEDVERVRIILMNMKAGESIELVISPSNVLIATNELSEMSEMQHVKSIGIVDDYETDGVSIGIVMMDQRPQ